LNSGSLKLRLILAGTLSILAALGLAGIGLTLLFERHVERRVSSELGVYLNQLVSGLDRGADDALAMPRALLDPRFEQPLSGLYWQVQAAGKTLRSRSLWDSNLGLPADDLADGAVHQHRITGPDGAELLVVERSVTLPARLGAGAVRAAVGVESAEITAATRAFASDLLPYLALLAIFLIAAAYAQVVVGLRPLVAVRTRLAAIRAGSSHRVGQDFPDEIRPLAAEVDALLEAREDQIVRARARAADLAHGFKTPLQVLSGDAKRLRDKGEVDIAAAIEEVAGTMQRHVDREIARARSAATGGDGRAGVADVVNRVLAVIVRTPAGARLEWSTEALDDLSARIDPDDLAEAVGNLIENAARHARSRVTVEARRAGDRIVVSVSDDGPGIPMERREDVMARGVRLDRAGDGAGLGLSIVRDIADAWGGQFEIEGEARGLRANLTLHAAGVRNEPDRPISATREGALTDSASDYVEKNKNHWQRRMPWTTK
jgi:signal transduction histidine kinase